MEIKQLPATVVRNNGIEVKHQEQRCLDQLEALTPGTPEYKDAAEALKTLAQVETERQKTALELKKIFWGGVVMIGGSIAIRLGIEKATDPHFRDLVKPYVSLISKTIHI